MIEVSMLEDSEALLRSVLNDPDWVILGDIVGSDLIDGRPRMLPGAFQFEPEGPSVYRHDMLRAGHSAADARKRDDAYVFKFGVVVVRASPDFDVIHAPESTEKDVIGYAHALVAYKTMPMDKSDKSCKDAFKAMRLRIMAVAEAVYIPASAA